LGERDAGADADPTAPVRPPGDPAGSQGPGAADDPAGSQGPGPMLAALLAALRSGRDDGAAALWAALTASARAPLGDVDGTRRALGNELLAPLVGHASVEIDPWERRGDVARTHLRVAGDPARAPSGEATSALYLVSARRDAATGWRLTGLRRDDLPWA
jgi:acetyl-CoA acetyltransferase